MAFNFSPHDSSSDKDGAADISAWQSGAKRKSSSAPRRTSGFQAVNQPDVEDIAMQSSPEPALSPATAPVAPMLSAADHKVISSGEESSSDDSDDEAPVPAAPVHVEEPDNEDRTMFDEVSENVSFNRSEQAAVEEPTESLEQSPAAEDDEIILPAHTVELVIPRDEIDEGERADCVDLTAGGEVVRRVLKEQEDGDGMMAYAVEFEDHHTEEVRSACDFTGSQTPQFVNT